MDVAGLSPTLTGCFRSEIGTVGRRSFLLFILGTFLGGNGEPSLMLLLSMQWSSNIV